MGKINAKSVFMEKTKSKKTLVRHWHREKGI
jgi:hypothetical protein